jgi:transcriptional regulator with XRE-family HTH domain
MELGQKIKRLRKEQGVSQERVARAADISLNVYNRIETGTVTNPHFDTVLAIAEALGVTVAELIGEPVPLDKGPFDTPEKTAARKAIGQLMADAGEPVRYLSMSQAELAALFDTLETVEEAQVLAKTVLAERKRFGELYQLYQGAKLPGQPTVAIWATFATAIEGVWRVAERTGVRKEEAEEIVRPLAGVGVGG